MQHGYGFYIARNDTNSTITLKSKTPVAKVDYIVEDSIINASELVQQNKNGDGLSINTLSPECTDNPVTSQSPSLSTNDNMTKAQKIKLAQELDIDLSKSVLNANQKEDFLAFIGAHRKIFAKDLSEIGLAKVQPYTIPLKEDAKPKITKAYPITPEKTHESIRQVNQMLKADIIEPRNNSKWQSPICLARKPNKTWRFTIDLRYPNSQIESENVIIPTAQEVFDHIADSKATVFSTLDMTSSFWQIPLDSKSQEITTFATPIGNYSFKRLPFGMKNSTTAFMATMHQLLRKSNFLYTLCYVDDVICYSKDLITHKLHLSQLFKILSEAGFTLNPRKCNFCCNKVTYLGYDISAQGLSMTDDYLNAVKLYPQPKNLRDTRGWLGLCNYYRRWIKDLSKIAAPLYNLLKKDTKFHFNQECISAFNKMKKAMLSSPVLAHPDFTRPMILTTDASGTGISYILGQRDKETNKEHPIAYGGRSLRAAERRWGITDREGLAVMEGIRAYRHYLQNNTFEVITDHHALVFIQKLKAPNYSGPSRLMRWSLELQGLDFKMTYKPGSKLTSADALSRREYPLEKDHFEPVTDEILVRDQPEIASMTPGSQENSMTASETKLHDKLHDMIHDNTTGLNGLMIDYEEITQEMLPQINTIQGEPHEEPIELLNAREDLIQLQKQDGYFGPIYKYITKSILPKQAKHARHLIMISQQYDIKDGRLHHFYTKRIRKKKHGEGSQFISQLAIPEKLEQDILEAYHELYGGGHLGLDKTYSALRSKYYFPQMYQKCKDFIKWCPKCQLAKPATHKKPAPLHPLPIEPLFRRWHVDCIGPLPKTPEGYEHILLAVESYSKAPEIHPLRTTQAAEIADVLYSQVFTRYGAPGSLVSDRHQSFLSEIIKCLCALFKVKKHFTSSFHPESNSTCEVMNKTIENNLRTMVNEQQNDWHKHLPGIAMAIRKHINASGYSPFYLLHGQEMDLMVDAALKTDDMTPPVQTFIKRLQKHQSFVHDMATTVKADAQKDMVAQRAKKACEPDLQVGDKVKMKTHDFRGKSKKLTNRWLGPYIITEAKPNHYYRLMNPNTRKPLKHPKNYSDLEKWYEKPLPMPIPLPVPNAQQNNTQNQQAVNMDNNNADQTQQNNTPQNTLPKSPHGGGVIYKITSQRGKVKGIQCYNVRLQFPDGTTEPSSAFKHEIPQEILQPFLQGKRKKKGKRKRRNTY